MFTLSYCICFPFKKYYMYGIHNNIIYKTEISNKKFKFLCQRTETL